MSMKTSKKKIRVRFTFEFFSFDVSVWHQDWINEVF